MSSRPRILAPGDAQQLCEIVRSAAAAGQRLRIEGGGSKRDIGSPAADCDILSMREFSGIVEYDPPELVLTAAAATPLAEIEATLAGQGQMLAFEPFDPAPILGGAPGRTTVGGVIASGLSGSQRLTQGAVRDHLLGFTAVSGRGETFTAGGKVVKNVTGYDLSKLMCASWGELAALTEVTLKVLPRPAIQATMLARGLEPQDAWTAFARLLGSPADIAAAAFLPAGTVDDRSLAAVRLHGFPPSVDARCTVIKELPHHPEFERASQAVGTRVWEAVRDLSPLPSQKPIWRINLPARQWPQFVAGLPPQEVAWMANWAGGLVWLASDLPAEEVRRMAAANSGHAMLFRASAEMRQAVAALQPQAGAVAALEQRVRRAFDPQGVFDTARMRGHD